MSAPLRKIVVPTVDWRARADAIGRRLAEALAAGPVPTKVATKVPGGRVKPRRIA